MKILSRSFRYLVGIALVGDGPGWQGPQGCMYGYSAFAEVFHPQGHQKTNPVQLHTACLKEEINHTSE